MSLFKARDFWSFELEQLQHDGSQKTNNEEVADFVASVGRFSSIGDDMDVIVAGNLRGFIYIIQISSLKQPSSRELHDVILEGSTRQLLAASKLADPIIDLKCGYFTSAIKQSIVVLCFDKLIVYQVKKRQVDLLSASIQDKQSFSKEGPILLDESLLSHELEQHYSIELLANEMAQSILVLDSHSDSSLTKSASNMAESPPSEANEPESTNGLTTTLGKKRFQQRSKQIVQQLHLPQRDKVIVQYSNQFLLTLVDYKKIVGHFELSLNPPRSSDKQPDVAQTEQSFIRQAEISDQQKSVGCMPMAFLNNIKSPSIVVSLSNFKLYCVPLSRLTQQAKQDVVKRVALNLLQAGKVEADEKSSSTANRNPNNEGGIDILTAIDLNEIVDWSCEILGKPIQMLGVHRRARNNMSPNHENEVSISQLLVMTRYQLDQFSNTGQHLWSLKFETPLICLYAYTLEISQTATIDQQKIAQSDEISTRTNKGTIQTNDEMISLVCTDCLNDNKSNLLILKEDQIQWSALLSTKPLQIWRINSQEMSGLLATLDIQRGQLLASYLGTNLSHLEAHHEAEPEDALDDRSADECFSKLEQLDDDSFFKLSNEIDETEGYLNIDEKNLRVTTRLEAVNQWPNVQVACTIDILPATNSSKVLYNMVAIIVYDDLLVFEVDKHQMDLVDCPSQNGGIVRLRLGTSWPDRRESIRIDAKISLATTTTAASKFGAQAMDNFEAPASWPLSDLQGLIPKSLELKLYLKYNETHFGTMIEEESILLPLSLLVNLVHLDYTDDRGQNLGDVLGNLGNLYKRPIEFDQIKLQSDRGKEKYHFMDVMLSSDCELIELIEEVVESDLICRGRDSGLKSGEDRKESTLENINLLAQSLDCRLRYHSPTGLVKQSSDDKSAPLMIILALKFENFYKNISDKLGYQVKKSQLTNDDIVWVHICDLCPDGDTSLGEELVKLHKPDWICVERKNLMKSLVKSERFSKGQILISVECENPIPVVFFQQHLMRRLKSFTYRSVFPIQVTKDMADRGYNDLIESVKSGASLFAPSRNLHDSLRSLTKINSELKSRYKRLRDELALEYAKFQVTIATSLSLSKRLPDLPEEMSEQSRNLVSLAKLNQANIKRLIDKLDQIKMFDTQLTKLPNIMDLEICEVDGDLVWPEYNCIVD